MIGSSRCDWSAVPACVSVYYFGMCCVVDALTGVGFHEYSGVRD